MITFLEAAPADDLLLVCSDPPASVSSLRFLWFMSLTRICSAPKVFTLRGWGVTCSESQCVPHRGRACGRCCFSPGGLSRALPLMKTPGRWDARTPPRRPAGLMRDDEVSARERRRLLVCGVLDSDWLCQLSRIPFSEVPVRSGGTQTGSDSAAVFTQRPSSQHRLWQLLGDAAEHGGF